MIAGVEQLADDLRGAYGRAEHQVRLGPLQERPRAVPVLGRARRAARPCTAGKGAAGIRQKGAMA